MFRLRRMSRHASATCFRSVSDRRRFLRIAWAALVTVACTGTNFAVESAVLRGQQIELVAGWNAIWLEVEPTDDRIAATFDASKIDVVARYFTPSTPVRFLQNPAEKPWNDPGWAVWYAPSRAENFLTSLHAVQGGCAYLVHATTAHTLSISGKVEHRALRWNANSFNLTGLPVSGSPGMTFARFFSGASGRLGNQIYRLVEGSWQKVGTLGSAEIRPGEAYWIFAEGKTNYQGPLELKFAGSTHLNLGGGTAAVNLLNRGTSPLSAKASIQGDMPLFRSVPDFENLRSTAEPFVGEVDLGSISAGKSIELALEYRPTMAPNAPKTALLIVKTSDGSILRVPLRAQ